MHFRNKHAIQYGSRITFVAVNIRFYFNCTNSNLKPERSLVEYFAYHKLYTIINNQFNKKSSLAWYMVNRKYSQQYYVDIFRDFTVLINSETEIGWRTNEHFVHDHAKWPPVAWTCVTRLHEDLRSNIVGRTDGWIGLQIQHTNKFSRTSTITAITC